jgi:cell division septation protein DedD
VLLGGLIQQSDSNTDSGVPFLNRVPVLGRLFGTTDRNKTRDELIVLITPHIIRDPEDARRVTDRYETQFESLKPILPPAGVAPAAASAPDAAAPVANPVPTPAVTTPVHDASNVQPAGGWAVQVASFTDESSADALRTRLQQLGFASYVESAATSAGSTWRAYAGPVVSRSAAELVMHAIADGMHISGMQVVQR